ncbi:MAG: argininosuccinate lyase [Chloroflexota bacterium]|nr:argininosuccinate lyase [Chloroflexota bacterium]
MMSKLWGGRYTGTTDDLMWRFNASIDFDQRLAQVDIEGSMAYARALGRVGVLMQKEVDILVAGLEQVAAEFREGTFVFAPTDEDIHTAVERRLTEIVGPVGGKLHTGRSRNDQVATDVRLYLMGELPQIGGLLRTVQRRIVSVADEYLDVLMPGYTHLQPAQPIRFSHWLLSFFWMLERDHQRLMELSERVAVCPLGAGALAGSAYGIDRQELARDLGFSGVTENSVDAVSDRDMVLETLSWGALLGTHLSRLAEDLVLWSSAAYGFVRLDERYTTGSSIMPQKRNPDSMELVRGKTGRLVGNLTQMLVVSKGIPSTYDKDLQEDKEPLFDTLDTLALVLPVVAGVIDTLQIDERAMHEALDEAMLATDLADYLVKKGVPFRQAHELVGQAVVASEEKGVSLGALDYAEFQGISEAFERDVYDVFDFEASVEARDVIGGTSRAAVVEQIEKARRIVET